MRSSSEKRDSARWLPISVGLFIACFLAVFYHEPLIENARRYELWMMILDDVLEAGSASDPSGISATPSGVKYLGQRGPHFARAALLLALAACHGFALSTCLLRRFPLHFSERLVICMGSGLAVLSLVTLCCGLSGHLNLTALIAPSAFSALLAIVVRFKFPQTVDPQTIASASLPKRISWLPASVAILIIIPFAVYLLLGAVSPPTDFDVREYHLQGPKEWFMQGQVTYLRHNVYTSFPFLSEMLCLAGMVVADDWWAGALAGQIVLACFQLLSTVAVFSIARRWIHKDVAWLAALIYLTTPWTLRISLYAYAEGALTFFLIAATMITLLASKYERSRWPLFLLCGLMAGNAMASKYTGLVTVIIPVFALLLVSSWTGFEQRYSRLLSIAGLFGTGVALMIGPWLLRNLYDTGNPVYPLGYSVFGGDEWSADLNARWKTAHGPPEHSPALILKHFLDVTVRNTWTSGLLFAFSISSVVLWRRNRVVAAVLSVAGWGFFTWWALTHRIDRFWIPVIPLLSIAAGSIWILHSSKLWQCFVLTVTTVATLANVRFCELSALEGFHVGLMDLDAARQLTIRSDIRYLNRAISDQQRVLMVGDAEVFDCTFPLLYNTVFDDCLFEEWTSHPDDLQLPPQQRRLLPAEEIVNNLRSRGITHLCVHWGEILRYRLPGSYGYTEYLQPSRFAELVRMNVLHPPTILLDKPWTALSPTDIREVETWDGFEMLKQNNDSFVIVQLFEIAAPESQDR